MNKVFLCSDWHFNHDQPFIWQARGFNSVDEMNDAIVKRHNEIVAPDDEVYILGDCCMGKDLEANAFLLNKLNGIKYFIFGNHDSTNRIEMYNHFGTTLGYAAILKYHKWRFYLSHYPTLCSNTDDGKTAKERVINICGHTHVSDPFADWDKGVIFHCEMDTNNCYPWNIDDIIEKIKERF